jgi:hypothetical protein
MDTARSSPEQNHDLVPIIRQSAGCGTSDSPSDANDNFAIQPSF